MPLLSIAVLVLVPPSEQPRFDYEHEHHFTEHEHGVVFRPQPTDNKLASVEFISAERTTESYKRRKHCPRPGRGNEALSS